VREAGASPALFGSRDAGQAQVAQAVRASGRRRDQTIVAATVLALGVVWLAVAEPWWPGGLAAAAAIGFLLARR
jgi:hypothetical protein